MVHFPHGKMRARNGDRVSFPRWGKRNVVSHHFTGLVLEITVLEMLPTKSVEGIRKMR
ncbi:MAG: hypothetical protein MUP98_20220 [Candidatus Aminicenantes bacterium]|nr:hypothetical protein [Candidatus Aminicenantes bacterium]